MMALGKSDHAASQRRWCGASAGDGSAWAMSIAADLLPAAGDLRPVDGGEGL
jgi:hypothetical protein